MEKTPSYWPMRTLNLEDNLWKTSMLRFKLSFPPKLPLEVRVGHLLFAYPNNLTNSAPNSSKVDQARTANSLESTWNKTVCGNNSGNSGACHRYLCSFAACQIGINRMKLKLGNHHPSAKHWWLVIWTMKRTWTNCKFKLVSQEVLHICWSYEVPKPLWFA